MFSNHFEAVQIDTRYLWQNLAALKVEIFFLSNLVDVYWQLQNLLPLPSMSKLDFYPGSTMKVEVAGVWNVGVPVYWAIGCVFSEDIQNIVCAYI